MRPITVIVGPSLNSSANSISLSQTPAAAGTKIATTITAASASIAATNTFYAGQPVTFQGSFQLVTGLNIGVTYYVLSTGLSGSAFQVSGAVGGTAITPQGTSTATPNVVTTGLFSINGALASKGVATMPNTAQRVLITTSDTTHTFTITGTTQGGQIISETTAVASGTIVSALDYYTVTSIAVSGTLTAAATVGTNGTGSTPWVRLDEWANSYVTIQCNVTGPVNYTVQGSMDDPNSSFGTPILPSAMTWIATSDSAAVGATGAVATNWLFAPTWARVLLNSGSGSVTATFAQAEVAGR
jgi:hypothetical protein